MNSIKNNKIYNIYCPFPSQINPSLQKVEQETLKWIKKIDLLPNDSAYKKLCAQKLSSHVARTYPQAELKVLQVINDFFLL